MTDPIRIIVSGPGPETGSLHDTVLITPAIARQIVAMATFEESSAVAPTAPVDDEATVSAILTVCRRLTSVYVDPDLAEDLIAAIRRGEVPGLTTTAGVNALREELLSKDGVNLVAERDTLKAEVERLRQTERIGGRALSALWATG